MLRALAATLIIFAAGALLPPAAAQEPPAPPPPVATIQWEMPVTYGPETHHTQVAQAFAAAITAATEGRIRITVHADGGLVGRRAIGAAVESGRVAIGERLLAGWSYEDAVFGVGAVPFLAGGYAAAAELHAAARPVLDQAFAARGLVLLYSVPWTPQGLFADRPLAEAADLVGLRLRTYNPITTRLATLAGMVPVEVAPEDMGGALANGTLDALLSAASFGRDPGQRGSLTHYYRVAAWLPVNAVVVNADAWAALDDRDRTLIRGAAAMAQTTGWAMAERLDDDLTAALSDAGLAVEAPPRGLRLALDDVGQRLVADWLAATGSAGRRILEDYKPEWLPPPAQ